jgi:glycosyltransferase involved in cell wall biosynthesis
MRIAVLASNFIKIPPKPKDVPKGCSGATEEIVYRISEELVKRGHKVTLFASGDSKTRCQLVSVTKRASAKDKDIGIGPHEAYEHTLISKCYQMAKDGKFDIIHSHFDTKSAFYAPLVEVPTVSTLHSPLEKIAPILAHFKNTQYWVSISDAQRKPVPDMNYIETIYHGLDLKDYPFDAVGGDYLVFVGRIAPEKGVDLAIKAARKCGMKLIILGWAKQKYFKYYSEKVKPFIDGKSIINHGFISRDSLKNYLGRAKALIFPVRWEEPFGLVMIEAMAVGTPVVAYGHGSVPEVVKDGETGYIINSKSEIRNPKKYSIETDGVEGLIDAVQKIVVMPEEEYRKMRFACRKHVEEKFTVEKMLDGYEAVYKKILGIK